MIFFVQPSVVREDNGKKSFIQYAVLQFERKHQIKLWNPENNFTFTIPVGRVSGESSSNLMIADFQTGAIR